MSRSTQRLMCGGQIRRKLHCSFSDSRGFTGVFNRQVKLPERDHSLRICLSQRFGLMRDLERGVALTPHEKIERNPRDHIRKQSIGHVGRCFRERQTKLLQSPFDVARL